MMEANMKYVIQDKTNNNTVVADDYTELLGIIGTSDIDISEFIKEHSEKAFLGKAEVNDFVIIPQYYPEYVYLVQKVGNNNSCILCESYTKLVHFFGNHGADIKDFIENKYPGYPVVEDDITVTTTHPCNPNRLIEEVYHIIPMVKTV
jgi:hypothetical protein